MREMSQPRDSKPGRVGVGERHRGQDAGGKQEGKWPPGRTTVDAKEVHGGAMGVGCSRPGSAEGRTPLSLHCIIFKVNPLLQRTLDCGTTILCMFTQK